MTPTGILSWPPVVQKAETLLLQNLNQDWYQEF